MPGLDPPAGHRGRRTPAAQSGEPTNLPSRPRLAQWLVILSSAAGVLGVQLISPLLPAMQVALNLSTEQTGAIVSAYSVAALLATLPAGYLADRVGDRTVLLWSLIVFGLSGLVTVLLHSIEPLLVARVIQGVAFAALVPLTIGVLVDVVGPQRRAHAQSYRVAAMSGAEFVLPLAAGFLVSLTGHWQVPFLLFAIPLVLAVLVRRTLPQGAVQYQPLQRGQFRPQLILAARDPLIISLFLVGFVRWWLKYGFFTFMPLYLYATLHADVAVIGAVVAVQGLLGAVVSSQTGRLGSGRRARAVLVCSTVLMGASVAALPLAHSLTWAVAMSILLGIADGLAGPLMNGLVGNLPRPEVRTTVIAISGTGRNLGKAVAPGLIGVLIAASGYDIGFIVTGALGLAAPLYLRPLWAGHKSAVPSPPRPSH